MRRGPAMALLGALLATAAAAYLPAVDGDFLLDDDALLADPLVRAPLDQGLAHWWASSRPVVALTFALNHAAVGVDPRGWHLTNVALHLAAVVLAWLLARRSLARARLDEPEGPALAAAAIFALHPLQSEAVAYLSQRSECLAAGLYLLALLLLLERDEARTPARRHALLAGAVLAQALGALAKPIVATLPAAWLLHAAVLPAPGEEGAGPLRRVRARLLAAAPLLALSIASAVRELGRAGQSASEGFDLPGLGPLQYLATELRVVPLYLRLALWPAGQHGDWHVRPSAGLADPAALAGAVFLVAVAGAAVVAARWARTREGDAAAAARVAGFGILFFLLTLAPSSSVVPLRDPLAEHRVYLGLLGLGLAASAGAAVLLRRSAGPRALLAGGAAAAVLLAALAGATARRAAVWTSPLTFWTDAAERSPGKARVQLNLGSALFLEKRYPEALSAFRRAHALRADRTVDEERLLGNLVGALLVTGQEDEARRVLTAELERSPRSAPALGRLAELEFQGGRTRAAESAALRALAIDPKNPPALTYLGFIRADEGDLESARALLRAAGEVRPLDARIFLELGLVEGRLGHRDSACAALARAAEDRGLRQVEDEARRALGRTGCR